MATIRLNRYLATAGVTSRRKADALIAEGRVRVNGEVVVNPGQPIVEGRDKVEFDQTDLGLTAKQVYILLNKPKNCITTMDDEKGRFSVNQIVNVAERVFPVGRLDGDTTGALVMTNDGGLAHRLAHPRYQIDKVYLAVLNKPIRDPEIRKLEGGVFIRGKKTAPCKIRRIDPTLVEINIHEGMYRQVRKMFQLVGYRVKELKRIRFGTINIGRLKEGHWRYLRPVEVTALKKAVGIASG